MDLLWNDERQGLNLELLFIPGPTASFSSASENAGIQGSPLPCPLDSRTLRGKDSFEIPFQGKIKVFMLCHEDTLSCYLKINTLNLKNADSLRFQS